MPFKLLVFDLDDTLYPEAQYALSGFKAVGLYVAETYGIAGFEDVSVKLFLSGLRGRIFDEALSNINLDLSRPQKEELIACYRSHQPEIKLYADAEEALNMVKASKTGLVTDGHQQSQRKKIEALNLHRDIQKIVVTDELGASFWKPNEKAFRLLEEWSGFKGGEAVYIGDNLKKDFVAPNALGWITCQVKREGQIHAEETAPPGGEPQIVVSSLLDLEF